MTIHDGPEHAVNGVRMDEDNPTDDPENYGARHFMDPEWTPKGFLAADITGSPIDPQSDATSGLIELITAREMAQK